jgi:hypothetical protein
VELLEHHPDLLADLAQRLRRDARRRTGHELFVADADASAIEGLEPVDAAEEGALAAARGPDDHRDLSLIHAERDAAQHLQVTVTLHQVEGFDHRSGRAAYVLRRTAKHVPAQTPAASGLGCGRANGGACRSAPAHSPACMCRRAWTSVRGWVGVDLSALHLSARCSGRAREEAPRHHRRAARPLRVAASLRGPRDPRARRYGRGAPRGA